MFSAPFTSALNADVELVGEYGNTLMGIAPEAPPSVRSLPERDWHVQYVPCYPYFVPEVVDSDGDLLPYGERGTVRLTVLSEDFFIPFLHERDVAIRVRGADPFPWDWLGTPETGAEAEPEAVEGVY